MPAEGQVRMGNVNHTVDLRRNGEIAVKPPQALRLLTRG
jgi:hypothetical protein